MDRAAPMSETEALVRARALAWGHDIKAKPQTREVAEYCPCCGEKLEPRSCKLVCPCCRYFADCSDHV